MRSEIAGQFLITQGADGSIVFDGENLLEMTPHKVTAVDTTGAGDIFSEAFLYDITNGLNFIKQEWSPVWPPQELLFNIVHN